MAKCQSRSCKEKFDRLRPEAEPGYKFCLKCMSEGLEQDRLRKLPGYKFFMVLRLLTWIPFFGFLLLSWNAFFKGWIITAVLSAVASYLMYRVRRPIMRRTEAADSLEFQDKQAKA